LQHFHKKTSTVLALLSGISIFTGAAAPAHAITLMDILRGGPGKRDSAAETSVRTKTEAAPSERMLADPEPLQKVAAPQYYTYKADAERAVKTAGFAAASGSDGLRSLVDAQVSAPSDIAAALEAYYAKAQAPLWVSAGDLNDKARAVLSLFERAGEFGLNPDDYVLSPPSLITASVGNAPAAMPAETAAPADAAASTETAPVVDPAPLVDAAATDGAAPADTAVAPDASAPANAPVATDAAAPAKSAAIPSHDKDLMQFELAMSAKVLLFAQDMVRGRVDANRLSGYHDIKRRDMNLSVVLPLAEQGADAAAYLEGLAPQSAHFMALKAELARLQAEAADAGEAIALPQSLLLKPGNSSEDLPKIVAVIEKRGSDALKTQHAATLASYAKTPDYTPELVEVVKSFQSELGLKADGVIGAATLRKMAGHTPKDKIEKVVVAMEQARWLPDDLGARHVFINQPAYRVYYHEHGAEQFSMRVVVGSKAHQTFFFQDKIETVEFNPYWGVPQSIIVNEMVPHLRRDPSYLDRQGYEVAVNGKTVPSSSVNWYGSTQNISVRQPPSSDNALGDLKILFPNAHAIYMHDTPSKSFFQRDMRALSHGCVRLAEPRKMAAAVLGTTIEDVNGRIAAGKNVPAKVMADIPVYVAYFTAWPNKDGVVEYFDDVYGRDTAVEKAFEATTKARASHS
jgi:murein L,D-transpeptidase YcbB/YkuD